MKQKTGIYLSLFLQSASAIFANESGCCAAIVEDCCTCNICPPTCEITPKAGPCVVNSSNFYLTADFIYWNASEENLEFATVNTRDSFGLVHPKGKIYQIDSNWAPGFKVGAGYDLCFDGCDIYAEYTYFHSTKREKTSSSLSSDLALLDNFWLLNNILLVSANFPGSTDSLGILIYTLPEASAFSTWHLGFNQIDLDLGRNFYISRRLMLRPYVGLKGMWLKQNLKVGFEGILTFGQPTPFFARSNMKNKIDSWAIGMLSGVEGAWHFTTNFSLIGNLGFAGLWQHFKISRFDSEIVPLTAGSLNRNFINLSSNFNKFTPVIEWMLGFRWESWFGCDTYHLALDAGWEMQNWFSQNKFIRIAGSPKCDGDLAFQGLTVKCRFDF